MSNSFEFNKIAGAVLGTALVVFGLKSLAGAVYHSPAPEKPGYKIEVAEAGGGGGTGTEEPAVPLEKLMATADAAKGQKTSNACKGCHDFAKGGPNKVGPNLFGVVDRPRASHEGFNYSEAMASKKGEPWSIDNLFVFLKAPGEYVPGTAMKFGGLKKDADRADLLAYLQTLKD